MKTKVFNCDAALWIGPNDHPETQPLWQICQECCDTIAVRATIESALDSPPRRPVSRVLMAQTNRHDLSSKALDPNRDSIRRLRATFCDARVLVIRGSLVAPLVGLPSTDSNANEHWMESISHLEAADFLAHWLDEESPIAVSVDSLTIVASNLEDADALMAAITLIARQQNATPPWMTWSRELTRHRFRGAGTILWDDSAAPPTTPEVWCQRINRAPMSRHLWLTGIASRNQRQTAIESGIAAIINKPGRLESLLAALTHQNAAKVDQMPNEVTAFHGWIATSS